MISLCRVSTFRLLLINMAYTTQNIGKELVYLIVYISLSIYIHTVRGMFFFFLLYDEQFIYFQTSSY